MIIGTPSTRMPYYCEVNRNVHIEDIGSSAAKERLVRTFRIHGPRDFAAAANVRKAGCDRSIGSLG